MRDRNSPQETARNALAGIIGDSFSFFTGLTALLTAAGINAGAVPLSHLCYRTATRAEYESTRDALKPFCAAFTENEFNGRPISMLKLRDPLIMPDGRTVDLIELPAPKGSHTYPTGLEHCGFVVGVAQQAFNARYAHLLEGIKDRGAHCQPSFITFENGATAKFYARPLEEVVRLEGHEFIPL